MLNYYRYNDYYYLKWPAAGRGEDIVAGKNPKKIMIIGLDCATPQLVFDKFLPELPNIRKIMDSGLYGEFRSTTPPITCPAWMCMTSGKDPGTLGIYGFRNRKDHSYDGLSIANSTAIKEPLLWDILGAAGRKCIMLGVPQTYPPRPVNGAMVTCFLTPSTESEYTYPPELKEEIARVVPEGYMLDVEGFRTDDKENLLVQIHQMTERRFRLAKHFITNKEWDFFMMVEMGIDRLHHGFWKYCDEEHPKHEPGNAFRNAMLKYYKRVDGFIGELVAAAGEDTAVAVVSDHGAKKMIGGICFNEWLIKEGYLVLKSKPEGVAKFAKCEVDWEKTKAWGDGGYYGRLFINVEGREPHGTVPKDKYEDFRNELINKLEAMTDEGGAPLGNRVFRPEDIYSGCRGIPPDLIVYFGDLFWRSVGSIGTGSIYTYENDTGPDDANHAQHGIFLLKGPGVERRGKVDGMDILDFAPTVLKLLGVEIPGDMRGRPVI